MIKHERISQSFLVTLTQKLSNLLTRCTSNSRECIMLLQLIISNWSRVTVNFLTTSDNKLADKLKNSVEVFTNWTKHNRTPMNSKRIWPSSRTNLARNQRIVKSSWLKLTNKPESRKIKKMNSLKEELRSKNKRCKCKLWNQMLKLISRKHNLPYKLLNKVSLI